MKFLLNIYYGAWKRDQEVQAETDTYCRNYLTLLRRFPGRKVDDILEGLGMGHTDMVEGCITEKIRRKRINAVMDHNPPHP
jgi:hypothetical protein